MTSEHSMKRPNLKAILNSSSDIVAVGGYLGYCSPEGLDDIKLSISRETLVLHRPGWVIHHGGVQFAPYRGHAIQFLMPKGRPDIVYVRKTTGGGHALLFLPDKGWTPTYRIPANELPVWYSLALIQDIEFEAWTEERWNTSSKNTSSNNVVEFNRKVWDI